MNDTQYTFAPRSHDRRILPLIIPSAVEREAVSFSDQWGKENLKEGSPLTLARDLGGSMILAWMDGRRKLVLVEKADLKEVTSWE